VNGRSWTAHYFERPAHAFLLEKSRADRRTEPLLHSRRLKSDDFYDLAFIRACMPEIAEAPQLARCQPTKGPPDSQPGGEF
jgi:hypothetical protein